MVPAYSHKVSRVSWYSGYRLASLSFAYGAFTLSDWSFQNHSATLGRSIMRSEPRNARIPVWALSISLAATLEIDIFSFFSSGYLDVSVHRVPSVYLWIQYTVTEVYSAGFPHSEIRGSKDICSSPQLIAACHVLLRLLMPRHSPCALFSLTCGVASCASLARPRQLFSLRCRSHSLRCSAFFLKNRKIFEELDESRDLRSLATPCLRDLVLLNYAGNSLEKL